MDTTMMSLIADHGTMMGEQGQISIKARLAFAAR